MELNSNLGNLPLFIDTTKIETIFSGIGFTTKTYTATKNCFITGSVRLWSDCSCVIYINDVPVTACSIHESYGETLPVFLPLKSGQTIKFVFSNTNNGTSDIYLFGAIG